ncbi:MAG: zinc-ribbon domain-containing protein, partial [bacterium]
MSRCPRCGKSHSLEDRFCGFCGYNLAVQNNS